MKFWNFRERVIQLLEKIVAQIDQLNAALAQLQTDFTAYVTGSQSDLAALAAQITALQNSTGVDLSGPLAAVAAMDAQAQAALSVLPPAPASGASAAAKPA